MQKGNICPFLSAGILSAPQAMLTFRPGQKIAPEAHSRCLEETCAIYNHKYGACSLLVLSCTDEMKEEKDKNARMVAEQIAREDATKLAKEEAQRRALEEAERRAKEDQERIARESAEKERLELEKEDKLKKEREQETAEQKSARMANEQARLERLSKDIEEQKKAIKSTFGKKR